MKKIVHVFSSGKDLIKRKYLMNMQERITNKKRCCGRMGIYGNH
jgi:hypothetical protein